jgi:hypothetical protein
MKALSALIYLGRYRTVPRYRTVVRRPSLARVTKKFWAIFRLGKVLHSRYRGGGVTRYLHHKSNGPDRGSCKLRPVTHVIRSESQESGVSGQGRRHFIKVLKFSDTVFQYNRNKNYPDLSSHHSKTYKLHFAISKSGPFHPYMRGLSESDSDGALQRLIRTVRLIHGHSSPSRLYQWLGFARETLGSQ